MTRKRRPRRPAVTAGLDFTLPFVDLYDEVVQRLIDRRIEDFPHEAYIEEETYERIYERAEEMVLRRLK